MVWVGGRCVLAAAAFFWVESGIRACGCMSTVVLSRTVQGVDCPVKQGKARGSCKSLQTDTMPSAAQGPLKPAHAPQTSSCMPPQLNAEFQGLVKQHALKSLLKPPGSNK